MKKSAKRNVIVSSLLAIILCISIMVGGTYAWFTDTADTATVKVQAGTLKVDIEKQTGSTDWASAQGEALEFQNVLGNQTVLWEPGATFETEDFRIRNKGTLALKYKMVINGIDGDYKLLDVIDFKVKVWMCGEFDSSYPWASGTGMKTCFHNHDTEKCELIAEVPISEVADTDFGIILPEGSGDASSASIRIDKIYDMATDATSYAQIGVSYTFVIEGTMDKAAGNEYQGLSIDGLGITVLATQASSEKDLYGPDYDKDAPYTMSKDLIEQLQKGGTVKLADDVAVSVLDSDGEEVSQQFELVNDVTVDINGKTIFGGLDSSNVEEAFDDNDTPLNIVICDDAEREEGTYSIYAGKTANAVTVYRPGTNIKSGSFTSGSDAVLVNYLFVETVGLTVDGGYVLATSESACLYNATGKAVINNGKFVAKDNAKLIHALNDGSVVTVNGGTFDSTESTNAAIYFVGSGAKVIINDGNFKVGKGGLVGYSYPASEYAGKQNLVITGGIFNVDPSDYVKEGYEVEEVTIDDATWYKVVKSEG